MGMIGNGERMGHRAQKSVTKKTTSGLAGALVRSGYSGSHEQLFAALRSSKASCSKRALYTRTSPTKRFSPPQADTSRRTPPLPQHIHPSPPPIHLPSSTCRSPPSQSSRTRPAGRGREEWERGTRRGGRGRWRRPGRLREGRGRKGRWTRLRAGGRGGRSTRLKSSASLPCLEEGGVVRRKEGAGDSLERARGDLRGAGTLRIGTKMGEELATVGLRSVKKKIV